MTAHDDVVRVASGSLVSVQIWQHALDDAGIKCHVVGDELTGGVGTAIADSIELWVHREHLEQAEAAIREVEERADKTDVIDGLEPTDPKM